MERWRKTHQKTCHFRSALAAPPLDRAMTTVNGSAPLALHKPTPAELQGAVSQAISEVRLEDCLFLLFFVCAESALCRRIFEQNFTSCVGLVVMMGVRAHRNCCWGRKGRIALSCHWLLRILPSKVRCDSSFVHSFVTYDHIFEYYMSCLVCSHRPATNKFKC